MTYTTEYTPGMFTRHLFDPARFVMPVLLLVLFVTSIDCGKEAFRKAPTESRPNVVFILIDTLRADRIGAARNDVAITPHLSEWASSSRHFQNAVTPCSWTKPAMASLFTGYYPETHHVMYSADPMTPNVLTADVLSDQFETLAEMLGAAGYATAAIQTNANLIADFGFAQGFDTYDYARGEPAAAITDRALARLDEMGTSPFFLYVHYMDVHMPYAPPPDIRDLFGPRPTLAATDVAALEKQIPYLIDYVHWKMEVQPERLFEELSPAGRTELKTLYDCAVRYVDQELDRLLSRIASDYANTLVIILSDHGEHFWEHGLMGHGLSLYEEEVRVPLLIRGPGIEPGTVDIPVSTIQLLPTIARYLGIEVHPPWQARQDLLSVTGPEPVFSRTRAPYPSLGVNTSMVREPELKLIQTPELRELYNLKRDPAEANNVFAADVPDAVRLLEMLSAHAESTEERGENFSEQPKAVDKETLEALGNQGYFGLDTEEIEEQ